jgi:hypothetical protein
MNDGLAVSSAATAERHRRTDALGMRIVALARLRRTVGASRAVLSDRQWRAVERPLRNRARELGSRLRSIEHLATASGDANRHEANEAFGEIELEVARAYDYFDTFMDILTQRLSPILGPLLAGCDRLADDALRRDHPSLQAVETPLVHCDRGLGASVLRQGVSLGDHEQNPLPIIQIPYSRLTQKYQLTSLIHEVGHEALARLDLKDPLARALDQALAERGVAPSMRGLFARWSGEIGPDFWAFCATGPAQAATLREVLMLKREHVVQDSFADSHPPPYLRVLLSIEWCRLVFGRGRWDDWEREWQFLYRPRSPVLMELRAALPTIARALVTTRFRALGGRAIPDLFDLQEVDPASLQRLGRDGATPRRPCVRLALFRLLRDERGHDEDRIDREMTAWLRTLTPRTDRRS